MTSLFDSGLILDEIIGQATKCTQCFTLASESCGGFGEFLLRIAVASYSWWSQYQHTLIQILSRGRAGPTQMRKYALQRQNTVRNGTG